RKGAEPGAELHHSHRQRPESLQQLRRPKARRSPGSRQTFDGRWAYQTRGARTFLQCHSVGGLTGHDGDGRFAGPNGRDAPSLDSHHWRLSAPQSSRYEVRHRWKAFTPMLVEEGDLAVNLSVLISSRVVQLPFSPDRP